MALKPDRKILDGTDISFFMNTTGAKGALVVIATGGSGAAMDDGNAVVAYGNTVNASGQYPLGILLCDVVNLDLTKYHLNAQQDQVQVGSKVTVCRRGVVCTDLVDGTPVVGQGAYASTTAGKITGVSGYTQAVNLASLAISGGFSQRIGTFLSGKDADGFAKIEVNLI